MKKLVIAIALVAASTGAFARGWHGSDDGYGVRWSSSRLGASSALPATAASASCRSPCPSRRRERRMGRAWRGGSRRSCRRTDRRGSTLISNGKGKDNSDEETRIGNRPRGSLDRSVRSGMAWWAASWRVPLSAADPSWLEWRLPSPPLPRRVLGTWRTLLLAGIRRRSCRRCGRVDLGASVLQ